MTHEEFQALWATIEPADLASGRDWRTLVPPDASGPAAAHADRCDACRRLAESLTLLATDRAALFDEPDAAHWEAFDERLARRLDAVGTHPRAGTSRSPRRGGGRRRTWLPWAAALLLTVGLAGLAGHHSTNGEPDVPPEVAAAEVVLPEALASTIRSAESSNGFEGALAPFEAALADPFDEIWWSVDERADETPVAEDAVLTGLAAGPVEALHGELARSLTEAQAAELARRLRSEMAS